MMSYSFLLLGVLPLIVFVLVDFFAGLRSGLIAAVIFAFAELGFSIYMFGEIDGITIASFVFVAIFAWISYKSNKSIYFKLQPVLLGCLFGVGFLIMEILGKPLLVVFLNKYQSLLPEETRSTVTNPAYILMLAKTSLWLGFGFLIHAGCVAYSAFYLSNLWWLLIRGIGLYVMMFACVFLANFF